ncbi:unnamed protein product [Pleuronectes platessa]|uniref:Uncharacterized protein n=1 Tax=Pleuronectes platessa TaxID=8262 RepID=A0A9N7VF91_PLEPL|nr:unnamed protein product [Pleuronectes platessa]
MTTLYTRNRGVPLLVGLTRRLASSTGSFALGEAALTRSCYRHHPWMLLDRSSVVASWRNTQPEPATHTRSSQCPGHEQRRLDANTDIAKTQRTRGGRRLTRVRLRRVVLTGCVVSKLAPVS